MELNSALHKFSASLLGVAMVALAFWLFLQCAYKGVSAPEPKQVVEKKEQREEKAKKPVADPLETGVKVKLAKVELPPPSIPLAVRQSQEQIAPHPAAVKKQAKQVADQSIALNSKTVVKPTAQVLAKGRSMLAKPNNEEELPSISGDYGGLGFNRYAEGIRKSGGKLVVYDLSGKYGYLPLVEIEKDSRVMVAKVSSFYVERPRFIGKPYLADIATVLEKLKTSEYSLGDLQPAFILPRKTEYFILGAIDEVLGKELYEYEAMAGEYHQDSHGKLVFVIKTGSKRGQSGQKILPRAIEINFGFMT